MSPDGPRVVVIDNYDSFTYNLVQFAGSLGADVEVYRNDAIDLAGVKAREPDALIISPGPGHPEDPHYFGVSGPVLTELAPEVPTLGVCLGMQGLCHLLGAKVVHAPRLMHGKTCTITHDAQGVYKGLPERLVVGRYHSLIVDEATLPDALVPTSHSTEGELMGVRHTDHPIEGVQFHPESILTEHGLTMIENFLETASR